MPESDLPVLPPAPPGINTPKQANEAFNRIMTGAATFQQLINHNVVAAARSPEPVRRAEAMNAAIAAGEKMLAQFRHARDLVQLAAPTVVLPAAPPLTRPSVPPLTRGGMPSKPVPRSF